MTALVCLETPQPGQAAKVAELLARKLAPDVQAVAVSAGGVAASATLAWALGRRSFRRVIHLDDSSLDKADFMTLGMVLAEVARHVGADVVIAGEHSDSEGQGLVAAALAHQLRAPIIARVQDLRLAESDGLEVVVRTGGRLYTLACGCPVVLTTGATYAGSVGPDDPTAAATVETISLAQLALDSSRLVPRPELLGSHLPVPAERVRQMTADEAARFLARRP
jgi:electron transfer flavoprotein alpha/beta subunit